MGIGRPNLTVDPESDGGSGGSLTTTFRFNLHMAIKGLTGPEAKSLKALIAKSKIDGNRKPVKKRLKELMKNRPQTDFESGLKLIKALNDDPREDKKKNSP